MTEGGYFKQGKFIKGIHPSLIGKKIIRTKPCECTGDCANYLDYSYCLNGLYGSQPEEWVILRDIVDGCLVIEWFPQLFPSDIKTLPEYWNDGNWIGVPA